MTAPPARLFSGIKVLAVARVIAAPFAARHLAVNGADVITIENPDEGDSSRVSEVRDEFLKPKMGRGFLSHNVNKRSLTLALNTPEGQDIFRKLVRDADVVIENLRTGTMARYGLGYADLQRINPGIIFCSVTGFGQTGPKARDPGIDDAIQAASGMMSITGTPETGPLKTGTTVIDYATGYAAAFAIAGALFHRSRTGVGQSIDLAMLEVAMTLMSAEVTRAVTSGEQPPLHGNGSGVGRYVSNSFRCKEGSIMVAARSQNLRSRVWK
jgi:crotonobetainyl-CoA:carnitine CoA-transferase CaiB-like acyl-CoA transferase